MVVEGNGWSSCTLCEARSVESPHLNSSLFWQLGGYSFFFLSVLLGLGRLLTFFLRTSRFLLLPIVFYDIMELLVLDYRIGGCVMLPIIVLVVLCTLLRQKLTVTSTRPDTQPDMQQQFVS